MEKQQHHPETLDEDQNEYGILTHLPISQEEMETLAENGFDDVESLRFLDINTLVALGINEPEQVFEVCQALINQYLENLQGTEEEQQYEYDAQQHIGDEIEEQYDEGEEHSPEKQAVNIDVKPPKVITQAMIIQQLQSQQSKLSNSAAAQYSKTLKGLHLQQTLQKLTHLHLNNKKLSMVGEEMEKVCKNLKVLYLFDNAIQRIDGLGGLKSLIQLSLYNNQIMKIEGLEGLSSLRRLYLEKNHISRLEGLTNCRSLEELNLSKQDIESDFTFDEYSLAAIANSLTYLDLSEARVRESQPLYYLERLEVLVLKKNLIDNFEEHVCPMLQTMNSLRQLDLTENPVNQIPKYRDQIIILTGNRLQEIDNKKVSQQERSYLMQLVQRKQRHVMGAGEKKEEQKVGAKTAGQFSVTGKNKTLHTQQEFGASQYQQHNAMTGTHGSLGSRAYEDDTQNQFYSPLDDGKHQHGGVLKQRTNIANPSFQNNAIMKKRSVNLNANNDFTAAGVSHMQTKHIPMASSSQMRATGGPKK